MGSENKRVQNIMPDYKEQASLIQEGLNEAIYQLQSDIEPNTHDEHIIELLAQTIVLLAHKHHTKH